MATTLYTNPPTPEFPTSNPRVDERRKRGGANSRLSINYVISAHVARR